MYDHRTRTYDGAPLDLTITLKTCGLGLMVEEETYPFRYRDTLRPAKITTEVSYLSFLDGPYPWELSI